jgi:uncharacterized protein
MKTIFILTAVVAISLNLNAAEIQEQLFQAAKNGDVEALEDILNGDIDVNSNNILGESALMFAIDGCQSEATRMLMAKGAQFEYHTKLGYTPLIRASALGCSEIVKMLIEKKAAINKEDPHHKFNALSKAIERNHPEIVQLLLGAEANANYADKYGVTLLMIAAQKGHSDIVDVLITNGADVNAKSLINQTALLCALDYGHPAIASHLIDNGANVSDVDKYNRSTLMLAATLGDSDIVKALVEKGVDLNLLNEKEQSAAVIAQKKKFDYLVDFLVTSGADTAGLVFADTTKKENVDSLLYDKPPEPIGGLAAIQKRLRYPKKAKNDSVEGTITMAVTVGRRGQVKSTKVFESFGNEECERAAIRAIKNTRWKAAKKGKKSVEAEIKVPVEFALKKSK